MSGGVTGNAGKAAELLGPQLLGPQMGCWGTNITACAETLGGGGWAFELDPLCGTSDMSGGGSNTSGKPEPEISGKWMSVCVDCDCCLRTISVAFFAFVSYDGEGSGVPSGM
jgi:hypothetical protein